MVIVALLALITPSVAMPNRRVPVWVGPRVDVGVAEKKNVAGNAPVPVVAAVRAPTKAYPLLNHEPSTVSINCVDRSVVKTAISPVAPAVPA